MKETEESKKTMKKPSETTLMVKDTIFSLPGKDQAKVMARVEQMKKLLEEAGDWGILALTLISAEMTDNA